MKLAKITDTHFGFNDKTYKTYSKFLPKMHRACIEQKVDAVLHCGDWSANEQHQVQRAFKMFRQYLGHFPIYAVIGNHDLWDYSSWGPIPYRRKVYKTDYPYGKPYHIMISDQEDWASEHDIFLMENHGPIVNKEKNLGIYGFNGWYDEIPPRTNDINYMPKEHQSVPMNTWLRYNAQKQLDSALAWSEGIKEKHPGIKTLLMTHHPSYNFEPQWNFMSANFRWLPFIAEKFDYYCVGHSHKQEDWIYKSPDGDYLRCINSGSCDIRARQLGHRYNGPNFKIFDTEDKLDFAKAITL
jgi:predicted phosphodiesterase